MIYRFIAEHKPFVVLIGIAINSTGGAHLPSTRAILARFGRTTSAAA